jgi:hypothetical protein
MGIRLKRLPNHRLNLNIYSGLVSPEELLAHIRSLDSSANWLSYFDVTADLAAIDIARFPELKHAVVAKEDERGEQEIARHALVNVPAANELFVHFWCNYACVGVRNPHERDVFPTVEQACGWLGLTDHGCREVLAEIEGSEAAGARPVLTTTLQGLTALRGSHGPAAGGRPARS